MECLFHHLHFPACGAPCSTFQFRVLDKSDVGKLAESICYCYWYWGGKYRFINGFLPYAKREGITIEARSKHADFIMTNISGSNAIMESKGTLRKKYNEPMNEALTQVQSVMPYVKAKEGWGCVVTFNYPDGPASLHLRDPMDDKFIPDRISYEIFRSSFASWFELFDMDDVAVWCRNPNPTNELSKSNLLNRMEDCSKNNFLTKRLFDVLGFNSQKAKFRLNPLILDFLFDYSSFKEIKYEPLKYNHAKTIIRENEPFLCPDGMEIWPE